MEDTDRERSTPESVRAILDGLKWLEIDWDDYELAIPCFLTMILMPFTYSITNGIGAGFVTWVVFRAARWQARQVHPLMWAIAAAFLVYFGINAVKALFGLH